MEPPAPIRVIRAIRGGFLVSEVDLFLMQLDASGLTRVLTTSSAGEEAQLFAEADRVRTVYRMLAGLGRTPAAGPGHSPKQERVQHGAH